MKTPRKTRYRGILSALFEYGLLVESLGRFIKVFVILLYVVGFMGLPLTKLPYLSLGEGGLILTRSILISFTIVASVLLLKTIHRGRVEKRKSLTTKSDVKNLYRVLVALSVIFAIFIFLMYI